MNLIDLLRCNHDLFYKMKILAVKQEKLIISDNLLEFLNASSKRKRVQQEILSNEREYSKKMKKDGDSDSKEKIQHLTTEIEDIILSIQRIDRRTEELLHNKKDDLYCDINDFRKGQKALKGYGGTEFKAPRYIDRIG